MLGFALAKLSPFGGRGGKQSEGEMSELFDTTAVLALLSGLVLGQVSLYGLRVKERLRRRAEHASNAATLLAAHDAMFESFVDDVAAPDILKSILVSFGDAISSHRTASDFAQFITTHKGIEPPDDGGFVLNELDQLRKHRGDLVEKFDGAIVTGFYYMILRWPDTARVFEDAATTMATNPRRGISLAARMANMQSSNTPAAGRHLKGEPALAC